MTRQKLFNSTYYYSSFSVHDASWQDHVKHSLPNGHGGKLKKKNSHVPSDYSLRVEDLHSLYIKNGFLRV